MLEISLDSPIPLGDQIVAGIRHLIASGQLKLGDELPPVRQLASDLGVNLNTVARAYRELETSGLAVAARGRGTRVTAVCEAPAGDRSAAARKESAKSASTSSITTALNEAIGRMLTDAKLSGFSPDDVRSCVERMIPRYWPGAASDSSAPRTGDRP
ncbi:MAG: GntR family transcriptional regulator [Planctomycetes bacterium]|nr:GntR family transcriptional regulator [Planctomycetota bacterium]